MARKFSGVVKQISRRRNLFKVSSSVEASLAKKTEEYKSLPLPVLISGCINFKSYGEVKKAKRVKIGNT